MTHTGDLPKAPRTSPRAPAALCATLACLAFALLALTAAPAQAFRGHVFGSTFGTPCTVEPCAGGTFKEPSAVAANEATGQLYVLDQGNGRIERFSSAGAYEAQFDGSDTPAFAFAFGAEALNGGLAVDNSCYLHKPALTGLACEAFDPSNGDVYVTDPGHGVVDKFSPAGVYLGQLQEASAKGEAGEEPFSFTELAAVSVGANGTVWVYGGPHLSGDVNSFTDAETSIFASHQQFQSCGCDFTGSGFAVDSEGNFYARRFPGGSHYVSRYSGSGELLSGPFLAEETSAVAVDLSSDEVFLDNVGSIGAFNPAATPQERFGSGHLSAGAGLAIAHPTSPLYSTVYAADSAADLVAVFPPEPPSEPSVEAESLSTVTATSATLQAEVNPRSEPGEAPTEYHFEYGPCETLASCATSSYESSAPVPDGTLAPDFEAHTASFHLQGLQPHTAYHFRVLAHNSHPGTAEGEEKTFTTQGPGGPLVLPDNRQWELVSPPDKHGGLIEPIGETQITQAAAGGGAMTFLSTAPTEAGPSGYSNLVQVLAARSPGGGWSSHDIAAPHAGPTGIAGGLGNGGGQEYRFFSEDLSQGVLQPYGVFTPQLSPDASEQTAFLRTDFPAGHPTEFCLTSCYRPLATGAPGFANVPEGTAFGEEGLCPGETRVTCGPQFKGATPGLSHVVLESNVGLTATPGDKGGLYEYSADKPPAEQLQLLSVLPGGKPAPAPNLGYANAIARNAISADGSRIIWSQKNVGHHLYLRDTAKGETVQLDAVQGGTGTGGTSAQFQLASADGSRVFFTDRQQLTPDSGAGSSQDLYECEIAESPGGALECQLTDLTPLHAGKPAQVLDQVIGASADASRLYFVADAALAPDAVEGTVSEEGSPPNGLTNLYLWHEGATSLVAVLSAEDAPDWNGLASTHLLARISARVSPDGRQLAFMSQRPLTGYDNRDARTAKPDEEVFLYHAPAGEGEAGSLVCASCNPTGARPHGAEYQNLLPGLDGSTVWAEGRGLAASLPAWTAWGFGEALYQSRYLSNSGRLFFNASDSLVPQDTNGTGDVYQYEPAGVGDCTASSSTFVPASNGCTGLISSGAGAEESGFLDASESGNDVFFFSGAQLASQDIDSARDVYDAHACSTESPCPPPQPPKPPICEGDACQTPAVPPNDATPGSLTFQGAGNVVECAKGKVKQKGHCVKRKAKHHKKHKGHKRHARSNRRASK